MRCRYSHGMRLTALLLVALLVGCSEHPDDGPKRRAHRVIAPASVVSTINLPGDDGRVHIVEIPGAYEVERCAVYVGPAGGSVTCMQPGAAPPAQFER